MKRSHRKAAAAAIILLNLLLLSICVWAIFALRNAPDSPSEAPALPVSSAPPPIEPEPSETSEQAESFPEPESSLQEEPEPVGLFSVYTEEAQKMLDSMTIPEKLGQLLLSSLSGTQESERCQPAGYVLFAWDLEGRSPDGVRSLLEEYQAVSRIPLVFAADEEGGSIVRASKFPALRPTPFSSPLSLYQQGGTDALAADAAEKSAFLLNLGIQLNLAPICDIAPDPSAYIYDRTLGTSAAETASGIRAIVGAMKKAGISSCLKHFPGYGGNLDTHTGVSVDNRPLNAFFDSDFLPFRAGIEAGAETVLVSHNIINCMEPGVPASLSPEVHRILREELGFTGIILTDDLGMDAIKEYAGAESPVVLALRAGNDLILSTDLPAAYQDLEDAWQAGAIAEQQVDAAVWRVLAWKLAAGIIPS